MLFNVLTLILIAMILLIVWAIILEKLGADPKKDEHVTFYVFIWGLSVVLFMWVMTWQNWWR